MRNGTVEIKKTVREVAEAMIADKTPKLIGDMVLTDIDYNAEKGTYKEIVKTCAIGGVAELWDVYAMDLMDALGDVPRDGVTAPKKKDARYLSGVIVSLNDDTPHTKKWIGKRILEQADEKTLNTVITLEKRDRKDS